MRRLVEQEQVAFIFTSFGTSPNLAIRPYLNDNKVPQIFVVGSGADDGRSATLSLDDRIFNPSYRTEAHIYAIHILATKPDARIGVLYQNDAIGKDYLTGLRDGLGADRAAMIVKEVSYEISDPSVNSQIVALQAAGPNTIFLAALAKATGQAIRKIYDLGWSPTRYISFGATSIDGVLKPAGLEKSKGLISSSISKDVTDPRWQDDPDVKAYAGFIAKYMNPNDYRGARPLTVIPLARCSSTRSDAVETICRETTSCGKRRTSRTSNCRCCCRASRSTPRPTIIFPSGKCSSNGLMA